MSGTPTLDPKAAHFTHPTRCRVGDLLIDTGRQRVTRGQQQIALPKLSYDLLLALVRAAPNLVSLDALMEQVWPKAVVSPETVSQRVKLLRDALGDDPRAPRYIEGLRGRGYRLMPSVDHEAPTTLESSQTGAAPGGAAGVAAAEPAAFSSHSEAAGIDVSNSPVEASPAAPVIGPPAVGPPAVGSPAVGSAAVGNATPVAASVSAALSPTRPSPGRRRLVRWLVGLGAACLLSVFVVLGIVRHLTELEPVKPKTSVEVVAVPPRSVAVLPFDNLSAEPNNDYIALGIADSVLHQLASSPELIVIARSSSFALGKPAPDLRETGRRLGVRYVVGGSVQRAGNVLRVTARLIDTSNNVELWSLKLDRTIDDVFALQDQIALRVGQQLDATVQSRSAEYARYGTDAYLAFLKGRALIESRKVQDVEASIRQFSRATELAPTFAAAIAELARSKELLASLQSAPNATTSALTPESDALIDRAISIDPSAGEPYFLRASRKLDNHDSPGAEADFRKGLELAPNFGPGIRSYAEYLMSLGRDDEALEQLDRARLVEPLSAENHYRKADVLRGRSQLENAAALYLQALSVQPEFYPAYTRLAQVRWLQGSLAEAIKYGEQSVAIEPTQNWTRARLVWFYVETGDLGAARDILRGHAPGEAAMAASEALVCYRAGNLERAASLLRGSLRDPDVNDAFSQFIVTGAIIERAIASRDPSEARQFILTIPDLAKTHGTLDMVDDNFPMIVQLAIVERAVGNQAVADDLALRVLQYLDPSRHVHLVGGWDDWSRAAASAILGRSDAALASLENLVSTGFRNGSWARIERDPAFAALRSTPRFQAIVSGLEVWRQGEVRQLALMRSRGEVPRRSSEQPSPRGC